MLLSGDHAAIASWRHAQRVARTLARRPDLVAASASVDGLDDLEVRVATAADAPELLVLQRACWMPEGRVSGSWHIPPLEESLEDVVAGLGTWTTWVARVPSGGPAPGRLVGSVRGRLRPGDESVWESGRLMVAPDLQGHGLGRALLELAESGAPESVSTFWINTGRVSDSEHPPVHARRLPAGAGGGRVPRDGRPHQAPPPLTRGVRVAARRAGRPAAAGPCR